MSVNNSWIDGEQPKADKRDILLEYVRKHQRGIEIGPYYTPIAPKAAGWNVLNLDVFDRSKLRENAANDPNIEDSMIPNIEEVDLLGSAHRIADLVAARGELGEVDFIVSSHTFEHLPDPIGFLEACSEVLRPGGVLSMAIPDKRCCFDYFRPTSTLGELLEAHFERRERPSSRQLYDGAALTSLYKGESLTHSLAADPRDIVAVQRVQEAYDGWKERLAVPRDAQEYQDCHCWTFTPNSFRLLLLDLLFLRIMCLNPVKVYETRACEFYVHLTNARGATLEALSRADYYDKRQRLLHAVNWETCLNALAPTAGRAPAVKASIAGRAGMALTNAVRLCRLYYHSGGLVDVVKHATGKVVRSIREK